MGYSYWVRLVVFMLCSIEVPVIHWEPSMTFHNKVTNDKQVFCSVITFSPCSDCGLHRASWHEISRRVNIWNTLLISGISATHSCL